MAKKPIKKAAKKKAAPKKVAKKAVKKAAKPAPKKAAKKVVKKVAKKVAKKAVKKVAAKKPLALPPSSKASSKAAPVKAVVKGRIPEKAKVVPVAAKGAFDEAGWNKMSDSQKRVFMATAGIKFMERGLKVGKGNYIKSDALDKKLQNLGQRTDLKTLLEDTSDVACCGAGILLYADVLLRGGYDVYKGNSLSKIGLTDIQNRLNYFSEKDLKAIEAAFETAWAFSADDKASIPAIAFGAKISDDRRRMSAILKNIIENDGTFKP